MAARLGYKEAAVLDGEDDDSDVVVLRKHHKVAVTPISLDMTSRVDSVRPGEEPAAVNRRGPCQEKEERQACLLPVLFL